VHHRATLADGRPVTPELVRLVLDEEMTKVRARVGERTWQAGRPDETRQIFERVALAPELIEFMTSTAYEYLD
jgi:malate synthase